ncbi:hypothetical protein T552_00077 [Pneumocystis carinii B80]|uniref:Mitochondrial thiamine pyrophosphate carrier 1 n=1 Tax=Pneumocystis carinii (strain B80) TaxID=1408658 RepID=A0A0W4ZSS6_PNEC8|nr:hypothetical protein T552_00077 [Pneumocystis carinii B80]KTW31433.1 hypothetical protein T552_00077 [Pneumocystis carinii B80]
MKENSLENTSTKGLSPSIKSAISGAISGFIVRFIISPFDVIKIRMQLQVLPAFPLRESNVTNYPYQKILGSVKQIIYQEGIFALWKGNCFSQILYMSYGSCQFFTYAKCKLFLDRIFPEKTYNHGKTFVSGAIAGTVATTVSYPFDLLRTRFAAQGVSKVYISIPHSIRSVYISEGIRGFYRGINASILQIIPYMGIVFGVYEGSKTYLLNIGYSSSLTDAVAGIISGTVGKTFVFPLDLIRKRLQVQGPTREKYFYKDIPVYNKIIKTGITIFKSEGFLGFYKGWLISILKTAPSTAITLWVYQRSLNFINKLEKQK